VYCWQDDPKRGIAAIELEGEHGMILGSILLLSAAATVVILLVRLAVGQTAAAERYALSGLAITLILGGTSTFAVGFLIPDRPESIAENPTPADDPNKNLAQLPPQSEPISEQEQQQLKWLHRTSVEIFIDRPGFGMRRLEMPLQDVVTPPKPTSDSAGLNQGNESGYKGRAKLDAAIGMLANKNARDSHFAIQDLINNRWRSIPVDGEVWSVRSLQLVGLVKNRKPVVYESNRMPGMKDVKDLPTRDLNIFETRALDSILAGEHYVAEQTGKEIRMLAPIFAGNRCLSCHDQKGQMLGAFTYTLERGPAPKVGDVNRD
jgi:hypothetical protein